MERMRILFPAAASGQVIPISELSRSFPRQEYQVNMAYAQSADLVRFLVLHEGRWRLAILFERLRGGEPFDDALRATWNRSLGALERDWRQDLRHRYSVLPSVTAGVSLWAIVGVLALFVFIKRRREIRRRIAAMSDEPIAAEKKTKEESEAK
jgi:hypothetical protein